VQFMHYGTEGEALSKWERRLQRMPVNPDRLFLKFDDRDGCTEGQMEFFSSLPFSNKVLFTKSRLLSKLSCAVHIPSSESTVPDGLALTRISPKYFDSAHWIGRRPQPRSFLLSFV
jgi:uncharacterized protein (DUF1919 family)